jgi:hypothetical protein
MKKSFANIGMALVNENVEAMKDGGMVALGKGLFESASNHTPESLKFLTDSPWGRVVFIGLMAAGVGIYNQPHLGALVNCMAAHTALELVNKVGQDTADKALALCQNLHQPDELGSVGQIVGERKRIDGEKDKDSRFSTTIGTTPGKELPNPPADKPKDADTPDYWPTKQSELIEEGGKFKCPICGKTRKRNSFGLSKFPVTHPGKPDVLCCSDPCRTTGSKEVKAVADELKKKEAQDAAIQAAKAKEERFQAIKVEITEAQALLTKATNSANTFQKMLDANKDDEVSQAAVAAAKAKVEEMTEKLNALEFEAMELEEELKMPKKSEDKGTDKQGKPGVVDKLRNGAK